jgi:hypothetical protein
VCIGSIKEILGAKVKVIVRYLQEEARKRSRKKEKYLAEMDCNQSNVYISRKVYFFRN